MMNEKLNRRNFIRAAGVFSIGMMAAGQALARSEDKPNILWVTSEDNGPALGCYGDTFADTPNIDSIAAQGMIYERAWSNAPVCAPARTTIISGVYPPSLGAQHMRSQVDMPSFMKMYPQFLREAGYYCTNNSKEDYNLAKPGQVWDNSSNKGHWRNRKDGQPFFAIFNFTTSHESQIRKRPHKQVHDPAKVRVPAYHPDTPEVRQDWAQYYDKITEMDAQVGGVLKQLREDGLEDNTIIFYYGDHGSGMPRSKRWPYDSGLRVPMVVHFPEKWKHLAPPEYKVGGMSKRLVGFVDLAPTLLSIIGMEPPKWMQGRAFAGKHVTKAPEYMFGFRGRMDERYDMVRAVTDGRYVYLRQYMPHKIYGQYIAYMFQTPTTQKWKQLYDEGKLNAAQRRFWERKPPEELYDLQTDPDEVKNLADSPEHKEVLQRLRKVQQQWVRDIRDLGFLPEDEIHSRAKGTTPYEMGHDAKKYPMEKIISTAETASMLKPKAVPKLVKAMADKDSAVRYWGAMGILMREHAGVKEARDTLVRAMKEDSSGSVRAIAAHALGQYGSDADAAEALEILVELASADKHSVFVAMLAVTALDDMDGRAKSARERIAALPRKAKNAPPRTGNYIGGLIEKTLADIE
ncbi:MAG: sulfatase-like hydrolase/transferase [Planctomycetota bacterium]